MAAVRGCYDDLLIICGVNLYPWEVEQILRVHLTALRWSRYHMAAGNPGGPR